MSVDGCFKYIKRFSSLRYVTPESFIVSFRSSAVTGVPTASRRSLKISSKTRKWGIALIKTPAGLSIFFILYSGINEFTSIIRPEQPVVNISLRYCEKKNFHISMEVPFLFFKRVIVISFR